MDHSIGQDAKMALKAINLITEEREKSLSQREWLHRIAGYGYTVRKTDGGSFLTALASGKDICELPSTLDQ